MNKLKGILLTQGMHGMISQVEGLANYRSSEGKKVQLKYRGKIKDTVQNILGGLRSSCTYVGAPSLKQLSKCTTFVRVNQQYNDTFE